MATISEKDLLKVCLHNVHRKKLLDVLGKHWLHVKTTDALIVGNRKSLELA